MKSATYLGLILIVALSATLAFSGMPLQGDYSFTYSGPLSPVYSKEVPDAYLEFASVSRVGGVDYLLYYVRDGAVYTVYLVDLEQYQEHSRTLELGNVQNLYLGFLKSRIFLIYNIGTTLYMYTFSVPNLDMSANTQYSVGTSNYNYYILDDLNNDGEMEILVETWMDQGTQIIQHTVTLSCFSGSDLSMMWTVSRSSQTSYMDNLKHVVEVGDFLPAGRIEILLAMNAIQLTPLSMEIDYFLFSGMGNEVSHGIISNVILGPSYEVLDIDGDGVEEFADAGMYMTEDYQIHYKYVHFFFTSGPKMVELPGMGMFLSPAYVGVEMVYAQDVNGDGTADVPITAYGEDTTCLLLLNVQSQSIIYRRDFSSTSTMTSLVAYDANDDSFFDILAFDTSSKILYMVDFRSGNDIWAYNIGAQNPGYDLSYGVTYSLTTDYFILDVNGNDIPEFGIQKVSDKYTVDLTLIDAGGSFSVAQHFTDSIQEQVPGGQAGNFFTAPCGLDLYGQPGGDLYYVLEEQKSGGPHYYHIGLFTKGSSQPYESIGIYWAGSESITPYLFPLASFGEKDIQFLGLGLFTTKSLYIFSSTGIPEIFF